MLSWLSRFNICCFLDNQEYDLPHHTLESIAAAGAKSIFDRSDNFFEELNSFLEEFNDYIFGHFNYDLKNLVEDLTSLHPDPIGFPDAFLFVPEVVLKLNENTLEIGIISGDAQVIFNEIIAEQESEEEHNLVSIQGRISKEKYLEIVEKLRQHILRGDCYEVNFCQEFYSESCLINPLNVFNQLTSISPNPFSAFYKVHDKFLICASPERYIQKKGQSIISQPIKGTAKRQQNFEKDEAEKAKLRASQKERSENVMVVDLVRNDLSKVCGEGTVKVDELFGIYSFPQVHQMISTVSGQLKNGVDLSQILQATFPMGSMTGAPKKKVLQLIEKYETVKRGIFSGTVGYITPDGDFDFNVVIRSLMYNASTQYLNYLVGSAITYYSNPNDEYEECLLKALAIKKILE